MAEIPATHRDLVHPRGIGTFVTLNDDGHPQASAVACFVDEDGQLKISMPSDRQKLKNLRVRPACTLLLIDFARPDRTLEIRAHARVVADPDRAVVRRLLAAGGMGGDASDRDGPGIDRWVAVLDVVKVRTTG